MQDIQTEAIHSMLALNDKPLIAIRQVPSVHALTDVTGMCLVTLIDCIQQCNPRRAQNFECRLWFVGTPARDE